MASAESTLAELIVLARRLHFSHQRGSTVAMLTLIPALLDVAEAADKLSVRNEESDNRLQSSELRIALGHLRKAMQEALDV